MEVLQGQLAAALIGRYQAPPCTQQGTTVLHTGSAQLGVLQGYLMPARCGTRYNGYVQVTEDHPWHGRRRADCTPYPRVELTYGYGDTFGFDTCYLVDDELIGSGQVSAWDLAQQQLDILWRDALAAYAPPCPETLRNARSS